MHPLSRRSFLKASTMAGIGVGLAGSRALAASSSPTPQASGFARNPLPRWRGFNLLDFFSPDPSAKWPGTPEEHLQWIADLGFDFVRIPIAYPCYLDFDRSKPITPAGVLRIDEQRVEPIDRLVALAHKHHLHVSLNLHRAPGYCVNAGFHEPYNLWRDQEAQDAFCYHWAFWAKRYAHVPRERISFDLVNEPGTRDDMNDQHSARHPVPGAVYRKVAQAAAAAIRAANPRHLVVADGNETGSKIIPEIVDLDIAQSCRAYHPHIISHYKAPWAYKDPDHLPVPTWPGTIEWNDRDKKTGATVTHQQVLNRAMLEEFYAPWIGLTQQGVGVHCGEGGCWRMTPHDVFLAWFGDVLDILTPHGIGYALWQFSGDFGIMNSNRADVAYEDWHGQKLDRKLLTLLQKY